jgi:hypothetical protein
VRVVDVFAESTHVPITYPAALTKTARASAGGYREFLQSAAATAIFTHAGFTVLRARSSGMTSGCSGFAFDVSREMALLRTKPLAVAAGTTNAKAAILDVNKGYRVALAAQAKVTFAVAPEKVPSQANPRAGILRLTPGAGSSTLRVSLDQPAWIDLVGEGRVLESTRHTGSRDCPQLHKSVEFTVKPGVPLLLQLSNSTAASLAVVVTAF